MYLHTRKEIIKAGFEPEIIESIAVLISSVKNLREAKEKFKLFVIEAEKLPWPQDNDFGALVLQAESANASCTEIKLFMLNEALARARWCATCATSGGEGLARMVHVNELKAEIEKYN